MMMMMMTMMTTMMMMIDELIDRHKRRLRSDPIVQITWSS
jgi:hypothetical protein